jgi:hypothetical protein
MLYCTGYILEVFMKNFDYYKTDNITVNGSIMDNGEIRTRMMQSDGSGYIFTEATDPGWQNSHYHKSAQETYIIQSGKALIVTQEQTGLKAYILDAKADLTVFTMPVYIHHNVYVFEGAKIHCVKHGEIVEGDWHASPELDLITKPLTLEEISKMIRTKLPLEFINPTSEERTLQLTALFGLLESKGILTLPEHESSSFAAFGEHSDYIGPAIATIVHKMETVDQIEHARRWLFDYCVRHMLVNVRELEEAVKNGTYTLSVLSKSLLYRQGTLPLTDNDEIGVEKLRIRR